jgi:DHA2 family multidrug resistance protein
VLERLAPGEGLRRALTFASVVFAGSVYGGATTIANAVLPQMQGDLSASLEQVSWVVTASVVAGAIGTPTTPWLAARFGAKQLLIGSLVLFTFASTMIGLSSTLPEVIIWRIIQSITGAPILALSQTFTLSAYPARYRSRVLAIWSAGLTCGWVFAPAIGAWLADQHSWRLVFLVLAPLGVGSIVMCWIFVPATSRDARLQFDWFGFTALAVALAGLQVVLNRGQRLDWFDSSQILIWTAVALIALYLFVAHSLTTKKPFINWGVFQDRNLSVGILLVFTFAYISLTPLVITPGMLERLRGLELVTIGFVLVPRGFVQLIVLLAITPLVGRVDSRLLISTGFAIYAVGSAMMANYNLEVGIWDVIIPLTLQGVAMSIIWLPIFNMMYSTLDENYRTDAAALMGLAYSLSSSAGVAVSVTLISRTSQTSTEELSGNLVHGNELLRHPEYADWDLNAIESLASMQAEVAQQALMIGYVNVFWMLTIVCVAAIPIVLVFGTSGIAPKHK